jgi:cytochrome c-type biogenesis protein CcmH/NrfF
MMGRQRKGNDRTKTHGHHVATSPPPEKPTVKFYFPPIILLYLMQCLLDSYFVIRMTTTQRQGEWKERKSTLHTEREPPPLPSPDRQNNKQYGRI